MFFMSDSTQLCTSCLMTPDAPEVEVVMVTAGADDLDMEAAPLDPLGLGVTRLGRAQALPEQIKPRKSLLIVIAADKFAEDNNSPSPAILEIRSLNIPASRITRANCIIWKFYYTNITGKIHHFPVLEIHNSQSGIHQGVF